MTIKGKCYRGFTKKEYAELFLKGEIRFSSLQTYKQTSDLQRRDTEEGRSCNVKRKGRVEERRVFGGRNEQSFVCCFSQSLETARSYGSVVVEVKELHLLRSLIEDAAITHKVLSQNPPDIEVSPIRYDKGSAVDNKIDKEIPVTSWNQKGKKFSDQEEVRLRFWFGVGEVLGQYDKFDIQIKVPKGLFKLLD